MDKSRVRPLWLLYLLIPLLLLIYAAAIFGIHQETFLTWLENLSEWIWLLHYGLIVSFFTWLRRHLPMRSFPWIVACLLNQILLHVLYPFSWNLVKSAGKARDLATVSRCGSLLMSFTGEILLMIFLVLIISDMLFSLRRLKIEPNIGALRVLARARNYSTSLGLTMLTVQWIWLFYLAYLYFA